MAKYLLKASLIPALKAKGIVSVDDMMTLRIPHRTQGVKEKMYEITFDVNEALETDNRLAMKAIEQSRSPAVKVGGEWYVSDPAVPWFDKLAEGDLTTSKQPHVHGDEALTRPERKFVRKYLKATGAPKPASWKKTDAAAHLASATTYFAP